MKQRMTTQGKALANRVAPGMVSRFRGARDLRSALGNLRRRLDRHGRRIDALEAEIQEQRRLNRRLAELTDVVQELLVPATDRDEAKVRELLDATAPRLDSADEETDGTLR